MDTRDQVIDHINTLSETLTQQLEALTLLQQREEKRNPLHAQDLANEHKAQQALRAARETGEIQPGGEDLDPALLGDVRAIMDPDDAEEPDLLKGLSSVKEWMERTIENLGKVSSAFMGSGSSESFTQSNAVSAKWSEGTERPFPESLERLMDSVSPKAFAGAIDQTVEIARQLLEITSSDYRSLVDNLVGGDKWSVVTTLGDIGASVNDLYGPQRSQSEPDAWNEEHLNSALKRANELRETAVKSGLPRNITPPVPPGPNPTGKDKPPGPPDASGLGR